MSSLKDNEKKALVKLQLKHKDTKEDKTELGFAVKVKNRSCDETVIITSSSVLPGNTLQNGYEVVINHYPSKSKLFGGKPSSKVKRIKAHDTMDVSVARFEGGDKEHFLEYIALPEKQKKKSKMLSAFVFEGKEIIELKFGNKGGSYQFNSVSKTDFDVKRAKGAPVIYQFANGRNVVVGVLTISDQDLLYPVLFQDHMFDTVVTDARSSSSDDVAKPGPSQISIQQPVVSELEQLREGQEKKAQSQSSLQQGQEKKVQGQSSLQQGQEKKAQGQSSLQQGQEKKAQGQSSLQQEESIQFKIIAVLILVTGCILYGQYKDNYQAALVIGLISTCFLPVLWYLINWALMFAYIRDCSKALKSSIKGCTEYLPKIMASNDIPSARTDDMFTNLTVYYDRKQVKKGQVKNLSRSEQLQEDSKRIGYSVKNYKDVFVDIIAKNLKRFLIIGKPGIGKSLFCLKLIRDWVHKKLFQNIQFTYLLTFRQLESLGDKELNFRELLNCSTLLDENSFINDSLFACLMKNPSKVLIILDGYDEYAKQHRKEISDDNLEQKYSNNPREKMPVPALCSKLIKGKIFRDSVVLISSRPGEAEELGQFHFDRFVEIAGFSSEQVAEFVEKYFSKTEEETKKTAKEHIEKNENLVSFCHIPLLCWLLCWCLEWRISQSGNTENLPAKITDLYREVVKVSIEKLHTKLKYTTETVEILAPETLTKLEQLSGYLLKRNKYIFTEEDMEKSNLTLHEIENLKISGILYSLPAARISAVEVKIEYSFIHLTLQEYLSACFFVKNKEVPDKNKTSGQTLIFMSGLLSREKDKELMEKLMEKLMEEIKPRDEYDDVNRRLTLQCLYEYGDDELSKLTIDNLQDEYGTLDGVIGFDGITDVNVPQCLSYLLNIIHLLLHHVQSFSRVHELNLVYSPVTSCGVGVLCKSLVHHTYITRLILTNCTLDDNCIELIANSLLNTKITYLNLMSNNITDKGAESILSVLLHENCCVEVLNLTRNEKITEECKERFTKLVREKKPHVMLYI